MLRAASTFARRGGPPLSRRDLPALPLTDNASESFLHVVLDVSDGLIFAIGIPREDRALVVACWLQVFLEVGTVLFDSLQPVVENGGRVIVFVLDTTASYLVPEGPRSRLVRDVRRIHRRDDLGPAEFRRLDAEDVAEPADEAVQAGFIHQRIDAVAGGYRYA